MNGIRLHILVLDGQDLKASSFLFPFRHSMKSILWVLMALHSEPFSNPTVCEAEPIVLHSPEAFNFQPCSLTILCSAYLKVIATLPTFQCSKAAAAGPAFYLCRAGSKEPVKARGELSLMSAPPAHRESQSVLNDVKIIRPGQVQDPF